MRRIAFAYLGAALVFLPLDFLWLTQMGERLYRPEIGPLLAAAPRLEFALPFYALYLAGLTGLAGLPAARAGGLLRALALGGALGLVAYGTYDLTNGATLKLWSWKITLIDLAWGMLVSALGAAGSWFGARLTLR